MEKSQAENKAILEALIQMAFRNSKPEPKEPRDER